MQNNKNIVYFITLSLGIVLLGALLSLTHNSTPSKPLPGQIQTAVIEEPSTFQKVEQLLKKEKNNYQLKRPTSLVPKVHASGEYEYASGYGVVDYQTGEIILEKNIDAKLSIASLTKIMTAIVALDLADPQEVFTVSAYASSIMPTKIGVTEGEQLTLEELLNALLLTSANDAAEVIREGIDSKYGDTVFIKAMNEKADFLGLKNTHFQNPQGFDDQEHYSSVEDLLLLSHYAMTHYPLFVDIVKKEYEVLEANADHKHYDLNNWNGLIRVYPNTIGIKIGNTGDAGMTTVVVSERGGKKMMAVVLGARDIIQRDLWASQLLDEAYRQKEGWEPYMVTEAELLQKYATWQYW